MSNIFPTSYSLKSSPAADDVAWGSDGTTNFNLSVDGIGNKVFSDRTTTHLSEGTNLYYTDNRVLNSPAIASLETDKAEKTNVLQLDNTTPYTPTEDYHPATKEYVDSGSLPIASTTTQGIIEIATDTEVNIGTDTTRAVTPSQINTIIIASDNIITSSNTPAGLSTGVYAKVKEAVCIKTGTYRINFTLYAYGGVNIGQSYGKIYKNGVAYGIERNFNSYDGSQSYSEDLPFVAGDLIQIYGHLGTNLGIGGNINTFQIGASQFQSIFIPTINL